MTEYVSSAVGRKTAPPDRYVDKKLALSFSTDSSAV